MGYRTSDTRYTVFCYCLQPPVNVAPMAVFSFLEENDISGKKVVLLCTHGTGGLASSTKDISAVLPDSQIERKCWVCIVIIYHSHSKQ